MLNETEMKMLELLISRTDPVQRAFVRVLVGDVDPKLVGAIDKMLPPSNPADEYRDRRRTDTMLKIGDRVIFRGRKTKPMVIGTIKSFNEKTVTIVNCTDGGAGWLDY
jgi:hypothetical protein